MTSTSKTDVASADPLSSSHLGTGFKSTCERRLMPVSCWGCYTIRP